MIGRLSGRISSNSGDLLIEVNGIGYIVSVSEKTRNALPSDGETVTLEIATCIKQESIELVGFLDPVEKQLFYLLNSVSGIGIRTALAALSHFSPDQLVQAIASRDIDRIQSIPGIGRKTAERIVVELRDKASKLSLPSTFVTTGSDHKIVAEALSALINLGYHRSIAEKAIQRVFAPPCTDVAQLIRESLKVIAS